MSSSEQEMSECSNSPASYTTLESPHSSPLQQVPQICTPTLSPTEKNLFKSIENGGVPFLRITEQPQEHFRFRYDTEKSGSTHGSILGKSYVNDKTAKKKKTHPTVELVNYKGKAVLSCSIKYDNDIKMYKNIYKILEDKQNKKKYNVPKTNSYKVGFPGIGIHTIKQKDLSNLLYTKLWEVSQKKSMNTTELRAHCDELSKKIDQNVVRLQFSAHDADNKEICAPVLSTPIYNKKSAATNALKICRMSLCSGRPSGGDDLFLLVDKIDKSVIKVRFYEEDENGTVVWSAWGVFLPSDVHHQCAIVCRTPQYRDPETSVDVKVWIELVRPSNPGQSSPSDSTSEPHPFTYKADPAYKRCKRRKIPTPYSTRLQSNFSGPSSTSELPVIVLANDPTEYTIVNEVPPQPAIQPIFDSQWNIISSTQHILENGSGQALEAHSTPSPMWGQCQLAGQPLGGIAAPPPVAYSAQITCPAPRELLLTGNLNNAAPPAVPSTVESISALSSLISLAELGIMDPPAPAPASLPIEETTSHDVIENENFCEFNENELTEYANIFNMDFEDLFQSDMEANDLVGDSGRVKVEPSTSSQAGNASAADARADHDVPRFQGPREIWQPTGARGDTNDVTPQDLMEFLVLTARSSENANQVTSQETVEFSLAMGANEGTYNVEPQGPMQISQPTAATEDAIHVEAQVGSYLPTGPIEDADDVPQGQMDTEGTIVSMEFFETRRAGDCINWITPNSAKLTDIKAIKIVHDMEGGTAYTSVGASENTSVEASENTSVGASENTSVGASENTSVPACENTSVPASENVALGANENSAGASKSTDQASSAFESADARAGAALFTTADAAEVKKLVCELCEIIRDKKNSKLEVAAKLERLFDIRLSNGDTFLHMTLFKSMRSFEALVKMVDSVKMSHLLNYVNNRGETILHLAVIHGTPELVALLVARGCDPTVRNCEDESAVHYAVRYASAATLRALLDAAHRAGAPLDLDAVNAERQSALHLCALHGRASCAALLSTRGASCGVRDAAGRTPLHLCAYDARVGVARALLPHAASHVHARDHNDRTPLTVACARAPTPAALELARALLAAGAHAQPAWRSARSYPELKALLMPHMPPDQLVDDAADDGDPDVYSEPDADDDVNSKSDDSDEYESADDEYIDDSAPDSLARELGRMALNDNAESSRSRNK